jgi:Ca2+-transporting ATPase
VQQSLVLTAGTFGALAAANVWLELDAAQTVTVTFLTLAFAQLWHVFNMRHPRSALLRNEVTRNPWLWGSLLLCTALLAAPPYLAPIAHVLHLTPPTPIMWAIILGMSIAPPVATLLLTAWRSSLERRRRFSYRGAYRISNPGILMVFDMP